MKFDFIVGNPPYQEDVKEGNTQAKPVYNYFVEATASLADKGMCLIIPSRWYAGGLGLDAFRNEMMNDKKICKLIDYSNAKEVFPNSSISGGVCIFVRNSQENDTCEVTNVENGKETTMKRPLNEFPVFVRYNNAVSVLHKVVNSTIIPFKSMDTIISSLMPFGLPTNYRGRTEKSAIDTLTLYASNCTTYISNDEIKKGSEYIGKYKVMMSKMGAEHAGEPDKKGMFGIFTKSMRVLKPDEVCTHSYFLIGCYDDEEEANNTLKYLKTQFVRFIVMTTLSAVNLSKLVFFNVPLQDFTENSDIDWSKTIHEIDLELYKKYGLDEKEIDFIETHVKEME